MKYCQELSDEFHNTYPHECNVGGQPWTEAWPQPVRLISKRRPVSFSPLWNTSSLWYQIWPPFHIINFLFATSNSGQTNHNVHVMILWGFSKWFCDFSVFLSGRRFPWRGASTRLMTVISQSTQWKFILQGIYRLHADGAWCSDTNHTSQRTATRRHPGS